MALTKQSQVIGVAFEIMDLALRIKEVYDISVSLSARYGNQGVQAILQALPTASLNADGTLGSADVTPVAGNPIDTRLVPSLHRAATAQEIIAAKNVMNDLIAFMNNTAVTTKDRAVILDKVIGT